MNQTPKPWTFFKLSDAEINLTAGLSAEDALQKVITSRFKMWLAFTQQTPDGLTKARMKRAFVGGLLTATTDPLQPQLRSHVEDLQKQANEGVDRG